MSTSGLPQYQLQTDELLFPQVLFNRPVTRNGAGRLLVVGGHTGEFSQPTAMNALALAAGAGECRVIMPDKLLPILGGAPGVFFGASTNSGSLSRDALGRILQLSEETDAVAIGSSLSNNSDTTMLAERLLSETTGSLVLYDDGLVAARSQIADISRRPNTLFILTMPEVFKLCGQLGIAIHVQSGAGLINKLEIVENLAGALAGDIAVFGTEVIAGAKGALTVTPLNHRLSLQPAIFYAVLASFWIQNRINPLAGLTTGAFVLRNVGNTLDATSTPSVTQLVTAVTQCIKAQEADW